MMMHYSLHFVIEATQTEQAPMLSTTLFGVLLSQRAKVIPFLLKRNNQSSIALWISTLGSGRKERRYDPET